MYKHIIAIGIFILVTRWMWAYLVVSGQGESEVDGLGSRVWMIFNHDWLADTFILTTSTRSHCVCARNQQTPIVTLVCCQPVKHRHSVTTVLSTHLLNGFETSRSKPKHLLQLWTLFRPDQYSSLYWWQQYT